MGASDAALLLDALGEVVDGLDRARACRRSINRPNIGTLHFMPMQPPKRSLWGVVKHNPDQPDPFLGVFEVEGEEEPSIVQEAHYASVRRLESNYLLHARKVLMELVRTLPAELKPDGGIALEDFRTISLRMPPNPFDEGTWKLRYRLRQVPGCTFQVEYLFADIVDAAFFAAP
jgi:hypothetical protein